MFLHIYIYTALRRVVLVLIRLPGLGSLTPSLAPVLKMANSCTIHRMNHNPVESIVCYLCYPLLEQLVPGRVNLTNRISITIRVIKGVKMLWTQQILTTIMTGIVVDSGTYNAKRH